MCPLLQSRDWVSSFRVVKHDLLGVGLVPPTSQVDVVQEEVIDSTLNHLEGEGRGGVKELSVKPLYKGHP